MSCLICVSSKTNNTYKVARYVNKAITSSKLIRTEELLADFDKYKEDLACDFMVIAFWLDSGHVDVASLKLMEKLSHQKIALLGTLGGDPRGKEACKLMQNTIAKLQEQQNEVLGSLWLQGKISPTVLAMMYERFPHLKNDEAHLQRIKNASVHPSARDYCLTILNAKRWERKAKGL